jgi:hypothetical protein
MISKLPWKLDTEDLSVIRDANGKIIAKDYRFLHVDDFERICDLINNKREYKCSHCGDVIGTLDDYYRGISFAQFNRKAMPIGKGSGLYEEWICINCDREKVEYYNKLTGLENRPWHNPKKEGVK